MPLTCESIIVKQLLILRFVIGTRVPVDPSAHRFVIFHCSKIRAACTTNTTAQLYSSGLAYLLKDAEQQLCHISGRISAGS